MSFVGVQVPNNIETEVEWREIAVQKKVGSWPPQRGWGSLFSAHCDYRVHLHADNIKYLTLIDSSKIWMPDTFFRNEKIGSFHNILAPNLYVRIFPNGDVLYSIRWAEQSGLIIRSTMSLSVSYCNIYFQGVPHCGLLNAAKTVPLRRADVSSILGQL